MCEPLSNFRSGQREDFVKCSRTLFLFLLCFVLFYFQCSFHAFDVCLMLPMFFTISFCFISIPQSRVFQNNFFSGGFSPPRRGGCVSLCGDRGRSLSTVLRGGLSPKAPFPHLRPSLLSPPPPRLDPAFKRSPTTPSLFSHYPAFHTQSPPSTKSRKPRYFISERVDTRQAVTS